jgi:hypothetical protein
MASSHSKAGGVTCFHFLPFLPAWLFGSPKVKVRGSLFLGANKNASTCYQKSANCAAFCTIGAIINVEYMQYQGELRFSKAHFLFLRHITDLRSPLTCKTI